MLLIHTYRAHNSAVDYLKLFNAMGIFLRLGNYECMVFYPITLFAYLIRVVDYFCLYVSA